MDQEEPRDEGLDGGFKSPEFAVLERFAFSHAIATSGNADYNEYPAISCDPIQLNLQYGRLSLMSRRNRWLGLLRSKIIACFCPISM